jgi:hypothetical protein
VVQKCVTQESNSHLGRERNLFHATRRFITNVSIIPSLGAILSQTNPVHIHLILLITISILPYYIHGIVLMFGISTFHEPF